MEEDAIGLTKVVPLLVKDILGENHSNYLKGAEWALYVLTDGVVIRRQNPASSEAQVLPGLLQYEDVSAPTWVSRWRR